MRKIAMSFDENIVFGSRVLNAKQEDKPAAGAAAADSSLETESEDSVLEEIKAGNLLNEDVAKAAAEEIKKRNKDRNVAETVQLLQRSKYLRMRQRLILRKNKALKVAAKKFLSALSTLDDDLNLGKHTKATYDAEFKKFCKQRDKEYGEADTEFRDACTELKNGFPGYYSYDWDYSINS